MFYVLNFFVNFFEGYGIQCMQSLLYERKEDSGGGVGIRFNKFRLNKVFLIYQYQYFDVFMFYISFIMIKDD